MASSIENPYHEVSFIRRNQSGGRGRNPGFGIFPISEPETVLAPDVFTPRGQEFEKTECKACHFGPESSEILNSRRVSSGPPALYEDSCTLRRARNGSGAPR